MMNTKKISLLLAITSTLLTTCITSCLNDGDETIIVEGEKLPNPKPTETEPQIVEIEDLQGESGDLRFNLQWDTNDDLDLMVITPCEDYIYLANPETECNGGTGKLDIDANFEVFPEHPQENIFWNNPAEGNYEVYVVNNSYNYKTHDADYNLTIIYHNKRIDISGRSKESETALLYTLKVTKDAESSLQ